MSASEARRFARRVAVATTSSVITAGVTWAVAATLFARRVVTPVGERAEDVDVLAIAGGHITLRATQETTLIGRYGLWQDGGATHARLGPVVETDPLGGAVIRPVLKVDSGRLRPGRAKWNYYYFAGTPRSALGLSYLDVEVPGNDHPLMCWLIPGSGRSDGAGDLGGMWAILVHGRGATREECLRAVPVLHRLGVTCLVASYRGTAGQPSAKVGRYHLGDTEWQDVESAIVFVAEQGAGEILLIGWSMGGAIVMQAVSRSWTADRVKGIVLDAPVLDWRNVLAHQARLNKIPTAVGRLGQSVLSHHSAWRLLGTDAPVDLDRLDWVARASELNHRVLLIHSKDDEFVPSGPSVQFAKTRPDLVTYLSVDGALHALEWNADSEKWDAAVATFILRL